MEASGGRMNVCTLEELTLHFLNKLSTLNNALILSNASVDQNYLEVRNSLTVLLDSMKLVLRSMRRDVDYAKGQLHSLEGMKRQCHDLQQHMQFVLANTPLKLPIKKSSQDNLVAKVTSLDNGGPLIMSHNLKPELHQMTRSCSYLDFLTVEEFEAVPKYMKGRLTYERANTVIEQLDKVFSEKYKLLKQKTSSLSEFNRKRVQALTLQETKDTEGTLFITEKDITDFSSLKVDNSVRNIVTILRHFNILHEIRGGGYIRFAVTFRY